MSQDSPGFDSGAPGLGPVEFLTPLARVGFLIQNKPEPENMDATALPFAPLNHQSSISVIGSQVCPSQRRLPSMLAISAGI